MKTARIRNNKVKKEIVKETEQYSVKQMIIIIVVLLSIFVLFYLITMIVVNNNSNNNSFSSNTVIDSSKITLGNLLNRKESEYYVLATKSMPAYMNVNYKTIYNNYIADYKKSSNALLVYTVDLDDALNKNYIGDKTNITNELNNLRLSEDTMFKIKNGKIEESYVGNVKIIQLLSSLKEN